MVLGLRGSCGAWGLRLWGSPTGLYDADGAFAGPTVSPGGWQLLLHESAVVRATLKLFCVWLVGVPVSGSDH